MMRTNQAGGTGLQTFEFREYPFHACAVSRDMTRGEDGYWYRPKDQPEIPMQYALKARWAGLS